MGTFKLCGAWRRSLNAGLLCKQAIRSMIALCDFAALNQEENTVKVILLEDVKSLGKKGDMVNASDGYARNMLFPKKLAVPATTSNKKDLEAKKRSEDKHAAEALAAAEDLKAKIEKGSITLSIKVGEGGRVFGSISAKEIAQAAKDQMGIEVDKKKIHLAQPIKEVGTAKIPVKLHPSVTAELKVNVKEA